jgi:hypothetical protein
VVAVTEDPGEKASAYLKLACAEHLLIPGSIAYSSRGLLFRCKCGPFTPATMSELEHAAQTDKGLRLAFPASEILLARFRIDVAGPGWVWIEGFIERAR